MKAPLLFRDTPVPPGLPQNHSVNFLIWVVSEPGVLVSNPLRACERYHAAWVSLKADLGNCALTAAISSSLVMTLFAVIASTTTRLMVRLDSGAEDSAIVFLEVLGWVFVFCSFLFFLSFLLYRWGAA
jgi:hypothetical protein